jgi:hypothetical protein
MKDFAADPAGAAHTAAIHTGHQKYQEAVLANAIVAKTISSFLRCCSYLYDTMHPSIMGEHMKIMASTQLPTFKKNLMGEVVLTRWEENSVGANLAAQVLEDCMVYAYCIISIVNAQDSVMATKISKKKDLAKSADMEMADTTKPSPSMQSMIDKAVSTCLRVVKLSSSKVSA